MDNEIRPVKTQTIKGSTQQAIASSIDDRLDTLSAAVEAALDPDATTKSKADALKEVRERRKSDATAVKR